ncbi:PREDICTED: poly(U)-specific endoribonuclease-D-like [Branchiostoma belcheri]|uniref:Uridylate-specific endoribonuclease n=1 Tax=Branchiostoma belcheri TaxID=7741 RepID=A0A6P4Y6S8_BRABE|nr:PREDICTED: poly(U)-specific endoribonuclease-D-like [Branchiostoma belcheri]
MASRRGPAVLLLMLTTWSAGCTGTRYGGTSRATTSCAGRCGEQYNNGNHCHCNDLCSQYGNCCSDYNAICVIGVSCATRCGEAYDSSNTCHCNNRCQEFSNCCDDYSAFCVATTTTAQTTTLPAVPSSPLPVTAAELSSVADDLWYGDVNYAREGVDFTLNLQNYVTNTALHSDYSSSRLFSYMNENGVLSSPTYAAFAAILNNYIAQTGNTEHVTSAESAENEAFLSEIMTTQVMVKVHDFLRWKGIVPYDEAGFKARLNEIWFGRYSRQNGRLDTSGFEHVFVGEVKNGEVSGMHSWVRFYLAEKSGDFDYSGYVFKKQPGTIGVQFRWGSVWKNLGGFFLGTSPEFDVAIYTLCFLARPEGLCEFSMAGSQMRLTTYSWLDRGQYLATAYP